MCGNPAVLMKKRFSDDVIKKLLELKWWFWEDKKINQYCSILCSCNIDELMKIET